MDIVEKLIGSKEVITLEGRIFHSVCLLVMIVLAVDIPFNFFIGLPDHAALMLAVSVAVLSIYYISRFYNKISLAIQIFQLLNLFVLIANYYHSSGTGGPINLTFILSFFLSVATVPRRQYWLWLPLNIFIMLGLLYAEYTWTGWLAGSYPTAESRVLNFGYTYLIAAALIFLVTMYIRRAYDEEREEVIQKARALKISNETQNKLLSILAHDLKEPLSSIQGYLELLNEYKPDDQEREHLEKELLNRTKDTSYLLTNVLSWTKNQMETVRVTLVPLVLQQTLIRTLKVLKSIANDKGIEFHNDIPDDICVTGDRDMLQLIIRNLVMNAIKFTHSGGEIVISTHIKADQCMIMVSDTGQGVPLNQQSELFSISAKSTFGTGREKGAGLGLVLCREFIELQGGTIGFSSEKDKGSIFFVTLPLCLQMSHASLF